MVKVKACPRHGAVGGEDEKLGWWGQDGEKCTVMVFTEDGGRQCGEILVEEDVDV